jgi:glutamate dehydrogenase/leucine dehydrogenase
MMKKIISISLSVFIIFSMVIPSQIYAYQKYTVLRPVSLKIDNSQTIIDMSRHKASAAGDSLDTKKTVLDIALDQLGRVVEKTGMSQYVLDILKQPKRTSEVMVEIVRDDDITNYEGLFIRVSHSDAIGISKGGMRYTMQINKADAEGLAFLMTVKCAGMGLPMGGGKGEGQIDINDLNQNEIARMTKEGIWQLMQQHQALGEDIDVPAPDRNTGKTIMAYMEEAFLAWHLLNGKGLKNKKAQELLLNDPAVSSSLEYYKNDDIRIRKKRDTEGSIVADTQTPVLNAATRLHKQGYIIQELAAFTDKPLDRAGAKGREEATGLGGYYAETAALEYYSRKESGHFRNKAGVSDLWHCLRGFGNVGLEYARECYQNGGKFASIQIYESGIKYTGSKNGKGIDINKLIEFIKAERKKIYDEKIVQALESNPNMAQQEKDDLWELIQKKDIDLRGYKQEDVAALDIENGEDVIDIDADILVEAATQCTIHAMNAHRIRQKMILELGNATTTRKADDILALKGVIVIPDVLANAGGVTVSMYEIKQNITGQEWPLELTYARLEERIRRAMDAMFRIQSENSNYRLSNRDAYWLLSIKRVLAAIESGMWQEGDIRFGEFISYHDTLLHDIYTPPQTDYELAQMHASGIAYLQEAVDREEYERNNNLNSIVERMVSYFEQAGGIDSMRICLIGGPTGYKMQAVNNIIEHLRNAYELRGVYYDLDLEGNTEKLPLLLKGERVEGIKILDKKTRKVNNITMQLKQGDILVAEGSFAIANKTLSMIPEGVDSFSIAVDINPCMNVKVDQIYNMMITNDDYTVLRELLMSFFQRPQRFDPYYSLVYSLNHRNIAVGEIYATFRNRVTELYNTYDPFELMFSREIALPILMQALNSAELILENNQTGPEERKVAEKAYMAAKRLIVILEKMPDISGMQIKLPRTHGLRQILPENLYTERFIPPVPLFTPAMGIGKFKNDHRCLLVVEQAA